MTAYIIGGCQVQIVEPHPRMVPSAAFQRIQSPELVASTAAWLAEFFGYTTIIPDGEVYKLNGHTLCMTRATYNSIIELQKMNARMAPIRDYQWVQP